MPRMRDIIIDTINSIKDQLNPPKRKNVFELLGYDFLIDEDFRVWLLEVNNNPYLGVPNSFIRNLLPQMIRDMFKIVIPGSCFQDTNPANGFKLILSDQHNLNQRRPLTLDSIYPKLQFKQLVGKQKKFSILQQRKDKFKFTQAERNSKTQLISLSNLLSGNQSGAEYQSKTSLVISNYQTQKDLLNQAATSDLMKQKSQVKVEDYKELHKTSLQNQFLLAKINNRSPFSGVGDASANIEEQMNRAATAKKSNFKKDMLEETKEICQRKEAPITQQQFDYIFNKIFSRLSQWELFDDKQIKKGIDAFEILSQSKAVGFFHNQLMVDKIIALIDNEALPFKVRVNLLESFEPLAKVLTQSTQFIENKSAASKLQSLIEISIGNQEDQLYVKARDIAFKILVMMLQIEQAPTKSYIPKITKEKELLKLKAFESGLLLYFIRAYIDNKLNTEIKTQILQKLSIKDLQAQLQILQQAASEEQHIQEEEFLNKYISKLQEDQSQLLQREQEIRQRNQEQQERLRQQLEEEKEQKRKYAEQMFFKRLEEKRRQKTEAIKKQLQAQEQIEKDLEEKRLLKLEQLKEKRFPTKAKVRTAGELSQNHATPRLLLSTGNGQLLQKSPQEVEQYEDSKLPPKKQRFKINTKKNIGETSTLIDNIVVFSQNSKKTQKFCSKPQGLHSAGNYFSPFSEQESPEGQLTNFHLHSTTQELSTESHPDTSYSILQNLKAIKSKHQTKTDIKQYVVSADYMSSTFSNIKLEKKNQVPKPNDKKNIVASFSIHETGSFQGIQQAPKIPGAKRKQMQLPSLDYDSFVDKSQSANRTATGIGSKFAQANVYSNTPVHQQQQKTNSSQQSPGRVKSASKQLAFKFQTSLPGGINVPSSKEDSLSSQLKKRSNSKQNQLINQESPMVQVTKRNGMNRRRLSPIDAIVPGAFHSTLKNFSNTSDSKTRTDLSKKFVDKKTQEISELITLMLNANRKSKNASQSINNTGGTANSNTDLIHLNYH